ncbi:MAG: hypothetical protein ACTSYB_03375 [Candidatus Helarchaeota archaeon]
MVIVIEFDPVWILIFFWTLFLSILCLLFGINLVIRKPRRHSSISLGLFFIAQFISFFTFPYIMLNEISALWAYKVQVIGYNLSSLGTLLLGRSLTTEFSHNFVIIMAIPAILITLVAWIFTPFYSITVPYGYELNIEWWFFVLLGGYGFPPLIYLMVELMKVFRTSNSIIRKRILFLLVGYISLVTSMTLFFTILPIMLGRPEIKPIGILISTICIIFIYQGYRPNRNIKMSNS